MKAVIKASLLHVILLATLSSQQLSLFGHEPQQRPQDKTFQQCFEEVSAKEPQVISLAQATSGQMIVEAEETIPNQNSTSVQQCLDHLNNKNQFIRWQALDALRKMGPKAKEAIPSLLEAMQDNDETFRMHANWALFAMGSEGAAVLIVTAGIRIKARKYATRLSTLWDA